MKKTLLGLGTLALSVLPIATMVSCSNTTVTLPTNNFKPVSFKTDISSVNYLSTDFNINATAIIDDSKRELTVEKLQNDFDSTITPLIVINQEKIITPIKIIEDGIKVLSISKYEEGSIFAAELSVKYTEGIGEEKTKQIIWTIPTGISSQFKLNKFKTMISESSEKFPTLNEYYLSETTGMLNQMSQFQTDNNLGEQGGLIGYEFSLNDFLPLLMVSSTNIDGADELHFMPTSGWGNTFVYPSVAGQLDYTPNNEELKNITLNGIDALSLHDKLLTILVRSKKNKQMIINVKDIQIEEIESLLKITFTFNNDALPEVISIDSELLNKTNLKLVANQTPSEINQTELAHLTEEFVQVDDKSIPLIKKLFITNATDQDLITGLKIKVSKVGQNTTVSLESNRGFAINSITPNLTTIDSTSFVAIIDPIDLMIESKSIIGTISEADVLGLTSEFLDVTESTLTLLNKFFDFKSLDLQEFILGLQVKLITTPNGISTITLKAKPNYLINATEEGELASHPFRLNGTEIIDLTIEEEFVEGFPFTPEEISELTGNYKNLTPITLKLIRKIFHTNEAIDSDLNNGLQIKATKTDIDIIVTIKAKGNYTINGTPGLELPSYAFIIPPVLIDLPITVKPLDGIIFTQEEIDKTGVSGYWVNATQVMLDLIKKVFNINGTSDTNLLNGLQVMGTHHIMSGISNINIIIKSKSGFTISGIANAEISSKTIIIPRVLKISNTPNSLTKITLTKAELEKPKPTDTFEDISDLIMFKINKTLSLNKISDTPTLEFYSTRKLL